MCVGILDSKNRTLLLLLLLCAVSACLHPPDWAGLGMESHLSWRASQGTARSWASLSNWVLTALPALIVATAPRGSPSAIGSSPASWVGTSTSPGQAGVRGGDPGVPWQGGEHLGETLLHPSLGNSGSCLREVGGVNLRTEGDQCSSTQALAGEFGERVQEKPGYPAHPRARA